MPFFFVRRKIGWTRWKYTSFFFCNENCLSSIILLLISVYVKVFVHSWWEIVSFFCVMHALISLHLHFLKMFRQSSSGIEIAIVSSFHQTDYYAMDWSNECVEKLVWWIFNWIRRKIEDDELLKWAIKTVHFYWKQSNGSLVYESDRQSWI